MLEIDPTEKKWRRCVMKSGRRLTFLGDPKSYHEMADAAMATYGLRNQEDTLIVELADDQGNITTIEN